MVVRLSFSPREQVTCEMNSRSRPLVGIGYREAIGDWTCENLNCFEVLEITVDHCIFGGKATQTAIFDLVDRVPLTAHGVGLSIGTDGPLDLAYLDQVGQSSSVSKRQPIASILRSPASLAAISQISCRCRRQKRSPSRSSRRSGPYDRVFQFLSYSRTLPISSTGPTLELSDVEFLSLICRETGAGLLLDIENLYLNANNHGFDAYEFLNALPPGIVKELHVAGDSPYARMVSIGHCSPIVIPTLCRRRCSKSWAIRLRVKRLPS